MKKIMIMLVIICLAALTSSLQANTNEQTISSDTELAMNTQMSSYTIHLIRWNGGATIRTTGQYDPSSNTVHIDRTSYVYEVVRNPFHGDGTKRGDYYYMAGEWFTNLD